MQTLGSVYAVLLAFVVFVVWQSADDEESEVIAHGGDDGPWIVRPPQSLARVLTATRGKGLAGVAEEWRKLYLARAPSFVRPTWKRAEFAAQLRDMLEDLVRVHAECSDSAKSLLVVTEL